MTSWRFASFIFERGSSCLKFVHCRKDYVKPTTMSNAFMSPSFAFKLSWSSLRNSKCKGPASCAKPSWLHLLGCVKWNSMWHGSVFRPDIKRGYNWANLNWYYWCCLANVGALPQTRVPQCMLTRSSRHLLQPAGPQLLLGCLSSHTFLSACSQVSVKCSHRAAEACTCWLTQSLCCFMLACRFSSTTGHTTVMLNHFKSMTLLTGKPTHATAHCYFLSTSLCKYLQCVVGAEREKPPNSFLKAVSSFVRCARKNCL